MKAPRTKWGDLRQKVAATEKTKATNSSHALADWQEAKGVGHGQTASLQ